MIIFEAEIACDHHPVKKNNKSHFMNRKTGHMFSTVNPKAKAAEALLTYKLSRFRMEHPWLPVKEPCSVRFLFIYPKDEFFTKKGLRSKNLPDLSNLFESVQDALQKAQIIEDDSLIRSHDKSRMMWGPEKKLVIEISKFTESEQYTDDD